MLRDGDFNIVAQQRKKPHESIQREFGQPAALERRDFWLIDFQEYTIRRAIDRQCRASGHDPPIICTPQELIEE